MSSATENELVEVGQNMLAAEVVLKPFAYLEVGAAVCTQAGRYAPPSCRPRTIMITPRAPP